jgi:hypothetical protein
MTPQDGAADLTKGERHDFDCALGHWRRLNRRSAKRLMLTDSDWVEFPGCALIAGVRTAAAAVGAR